MFNTIGAREKTFKKIGQMNGGKRGLNLLVFPDQGFGNRLILKIAFFLVETKLPTPGPLGWGYGNLIQALYTSRCILTKKAILGISGEYAKYLYDLGSSHPSASPTKKYDYFNSFVPAVQDLPGTSLDWRKMICCQKPGFWETDWKKNDLEGYQVEEALLFTVAIWREQHIPKYPTISLQQINTTTVCEHQGICIPSSAPQLAIATLVYTTWVYGLCMYIHIYI